MKNKRVYVITLIVMVISTIVNLLFVGYGGFTIYNLKTQYYDNIDYTFLNMSEREILQAELLLDNIQDDFLSSVKEIIFTTDSNKCEDVGSSYGAVGCYRRGIIIVEWQDKDFDYNAEILCHEILHAHFKLMKGDQIEDDSHSALDWVAQREGCYIEDVFRLSQPFIIIKESCYTENNCTINKVNSMVIEIMRNISNYEYCDKIGWESIGIQEGYGCVNFISKTELSMEFLNKNCDLIEEDHYECNFDNKYLVEILK